MIFRALPARLATVSVWMAITATLGAAVPAATLHLHAGPAGPRVADETALALTVGHEVRIGLLPSAFDAGRFGWDPVEVGRFWQPLGQTTTRALLGDPGRYAVTLHLTDQALAGRRVHVWILRASDGQPIRSDYANVHSHLLVTSTRANWRIPTASALPPANAALLALGEVDTLITGVRTATALQTKRPGITYPEWVEVQLGSPTTGRTPDADFDADQLANGLEFIFGSDPLQPSTLPIFHTVVASEGKHYLEMTFRLPRGRLDAPWAVQVSGDLANWSTTPFVAVTNQHDGTDLVVARDNVAMEDSPGRRFIRIVGQF